MKFTDEDKVFFIGKVVGTLSADDLAGDYEIKKYLVANG
jgi:hypothetical protein